MSQEVRKVPANWQHPKNEKGRYIPLFGSHFREHAAEWDEEATQWDRGFYYCSTSNAWKPKTSEMIGTFGESAGERPVESDYMPDWPEVQRTHYQMYESVTEGTPISPVMETPEALARWLADNNALAGHPYGRVTHNQWLAMIKIGFSGGSFGLNAATGEIMSGVEVVSRL